MAKAEMGYAVRLNLSLNEAVAIYRLVGGCNGKTDAALGLDSYSLYEALHNVLEELNALDQCVGAHVEVNVQHT